MSMSSILFIGVTLSVVGFGENSNEGYDYQGNEGESIEIPCGPFLEQTGKIFMYYNITESSEIVLMHSSSEYLMINLTAYNDKSKIRCVVDERYFSYIISVIYSPKLLNPSIENSFANLNQPYSLHCPLVSNPSPTCSWEIYYCAKPNNSLNIFDYGISISEKDSCLINVVKITTEFDLLCIKCVATNYVGSDWFEFNQIEFSYCPDEQSIYISSLNFEESSVIHVQEGGNITLKCIGYGFGPVNEVYWLFNHTQLLTIDSDSEYKYKLCQKTSVWTGIHINENASGTYMCMIHGRNTQEFIHNEIQVVVSNNEEMSTVNEKDDDHYILLVGICGLLLVSTISFLFVFLAFYIRRFMSGSESTFQRLHNSYDDDDSQCDYDAFISFAEENKAEAEEKIKQPLENLEYKICWHHENFIPGFTVNENMEMSILRSKFTIALISQDFFKSDYCKNELDIVRRKVQNTNHNCLVPIMIEKWEAVPTEILKITYIDVDDQMLIPRLERILGMPMKSQPLAEPTLVKDLKDKDNRAITESFV